MTEKKINMESVYLPSDKVVAREIEGELIIVPIGSGFADFNDTLYSLNETGKTVWNLLDKKRSVKEICAKLTNLYQAQPGTIEKDVLQLLEDLLGMGIIAPLNG